MKKQSQSLADKIIANTLIVHIIVSVLYAGLLLLALWLIQRIFEHV